MHFSNYFRVPGKQRESMVENGFLSTCLHHCEAIFLLTQSNDKQNIRPVNALIYCANMKLWGNIKKMERHVEWCTRLEL